MHEPTSWSKVHESCLLCYCRKSLGCPLQTLPKKFTYVVHIFPDDYFDVFHDYSCLLFQKAVCPTCLSTVLFHLLCLHFSSFHIISVHFTSIDLISLVCISFDFISFNFILIYFMSFNLISFYFTSFDLILLYFTIIIHTRFV